MKLKVSQEQAEAVASRQVKGTLFDACGDESDRPVARVEFRPFGDSWVTAEGQLRTVWITEPDSEGNSRQFMALGIGAADLKRWCAEERSVPVETVQLWFEGE